MWFQRTDEQQFMYTDYWPSDEHHFCLLPLEDSASNQERQCASVPTSVVGSNNPQPIMAQDGLSHLFWRKSGLDGIMELIHSKVLINETADTSLLWQEVTIPPDQLHPTLSFAHWQRKFGQSAGSGLGLSVDDGISTTAVFTGTGTAGWQYQSVDLEPWSGQTVTLTFELTQLAGDTGLWLHLDELYLGSASPDTWLAVETRGPAFPGSELTLQMAYGNRSSALATDGQIALTLPPELSFVESWPLPTYENGGLTWDVGALSAGHTNHNTVTLLISDTLEQRMVMPVSAELTSATPELATNNNLVQVDIPVGGQAYAPLGDANRRA
jgi:hypothetical protein